MGTRLGGSSSVAEVLKCDRNRRTIELELCSRQCCSAAVMASHSPLPAVGEENTQLGQKAQRLCQDLLHELVGTGGAEHDRPDQ